MKKKEKEEKLEAIARAVVSCRRCSLWQRAVNGVPGEGPAEAKIMFIGEGPGYYEDQKGIPFCGASGRLLDSLLLSIKVKRSGVFIGNVIKHRPPGNRDPLPEEIEACRPFLDQQIEVVDPEVIVTLGRFSMNKFLPGEKISQIHGQARYVDFAGRQRVVLPMYHPAAALRSGSIMAEIKKDFLKIPLFLKGKAAVKPAPLVTEEKETQLKLV